MATRVPRIPTTAATRPRIFSHRCNPLVVGSGSLTGSPPGPGAGASDSGISDDDTLRHDPAGGSGIPAHGTTMYLRRPWRLVASVRRGRHGPWQRGRAGRADGDDGMGRAGASHGSDDERAVPATSAAARSVPACGPVLDPGA